MILGLFVYNSGSDLVSHQTCLLAVPRAVVSVFQVLGGGVTYHIGLANGTNNTHTELWIFNIGSAKGMKQPMATSCRVDPCHSLPVVRTGPSQSVYLGTHLV